MDALSRRFLLKAGPYQFIKGWTFLLFDLHGHKPLYQMHTENSDPDLMADFNEEGWTRFYIRVSELLELNAPVKGIFGESWFFDPALENISPRLNYLRKLPCENGGQLFRVCSNIHSIRNATLKSPTRSALYQEGRYMPTDYLLIWPRNRLIGWAKKVMNGKLSALVSS